MTQQRTSRDADRRSFGPAALARTLAWLRLCAVLGQTATVVFVGRYLQLPLAEAALFGGIGVLAAFGLAVLWRLRQPWPITTTEVMAHIGVDTVVLSWLLYLTGGASNPFVGLLLMPITLAATALKLRDVAVIAALSCAAYLVLMQWNVPLAGTQLEGTDARTFGLHVLGMAASFAISAVLLGGFISRLAEALREKQVETQRIRERALRDEGILAIATQAAGAAHELNTPLSTMRTLVGELRREHPDGTLGEDLALLSSQLERCRETLRELVAVGKAQLEQAGERVSVADFVNGCGDRLQLLRPEILYKVTLPDDASEWIVEVPAGLRHAVINLLNNAAEASLANNSAEVDVAVAREGAQLVLRVRDHGRGIAQADRLGTRFESSKSTGLGIGFALADATAERLGGDLVISAADGGGTETRLSVPLQSVRLTIH